MLEILEGLESLEELVMANVEEELASIGGGDMLSLDSLLGELEELEEDEYSHGVSETVALPVSLKGVYSPIGLLSSGFVAPLHELKLNPKLILIAK